MTSARARVRRTAVSIVLGGCLLASAACGGGDDPATELTLDEPSSTTPSEEASPSDDASSSSGESDRVPKDPVDGEFIRGRAAADGEAEEAVAETWFSYWEEVTRMYRTQEKDRDTLYSLSTDSAASGPLSYLDDSLEAGNTQRGGTIGAITSVTVDGDEAVVSGCFRDDSQDVNADGDPVEQPVRFFQTTDTLRKEGPDWRVTEAKSLPSLAGVQCRYR